MATSPTPASNGNNASSDSLNEVTDKDLQAGSSHPLRHRWVLHFNAPAEARRGDWNVAVKKVHTLTTVEDFWSLFNAIRSPSQLQVGSNYHFFKEGINPEWEDEANRKGGKWAFAIKRGGGEQRANKQTDDVWLYTLLLLIGDQLSDGQEITGFVVSPRAKENRLALWTRQADDEDVVMRIGTEWKKVISEFYSDIRELGYQSHSDAMQSARSYKNPTLHIL